MNTSKKIISLMMCMLMVLTMVPMSVFAEGETTIDTIHIEGVPAPVYGQTVKEYNTVMYNGSMDGTHKINGSTRVDIAEGIFYGNIELVEWDYYNSEKSSYLTFTEALPSVYYFVQWLNPAAEYKFADDVAVTVDGAVSVETEIDEDGWLTVWAKFEVEAPIIDTIHIEGIPAPVYGQTVKEYNTVMHNGSMDGTHKINGSTRVDIAEGIFYGNIELVEWDYCNSEKSSYLTFTEALPSVYYFVQWLNPVAEYKFADDVAVTVDGAVCVETELDEDGWLTVWAKFEVAPPTEIDTIHVEGVLAPQYGDTVQDHFDDMIKKGDDGEFKVNGLGYYVCDLFDDMGFSLLDKDKKRLDKSEVIVEGIYYFAMEFLPSDGYVIPNDVAVTLDGALSVETEFDEDGWLIAYAKYEVKATEIDTIHIEGIPAPLYGQTVKEYNTVMYNGSMDGTHKINGSTRVNNSEDVFYGNIELGDWEYYNSEKSYLAPSSAEALPSVYYLVHWLYPAAGYKFPDDVAVTVDGAVSVETELDEDGCLAVWAKFEIAPPTEIDTIHIEGVPAPQYGQTIKSYYEAIEAKITDGTITVNDEVYDSTAYKYGNLFDDGWNVRTEADGPLDEDSTDLIKEGTYYVAMWFYPDLGYVIPEDVNVIFDGAKSVKIEVEDDGCLDIRAEYEVKCPHAYESVITKATLTANGLIESKCSICGNVASSQTITKIGSVTLSAEKYVHDGKNKTPAVTVKDANGKKLVKNTDYKLSVASKRSGIGKYTVKVTFIGKYSGTKNVYFTILPGKPASVKSAAQTTSSVKLTWSKVSGAAGYTVYRYSPSKKAYVKAGTTEGTSLTVKGLLAGTKYTFKVVAYGKTSGGKVYNSEGYTLLKTATKTKTPAISKITTTKGKAVLTHTNVSGETGYTVYYSTKKDSGFKKYANFKADTTRCDITKLTSGKTYYFKVRAYTKTDSGTVYSAWSSVKSVKVK